MRFALVTSGIFTTFLVIIQGVTSQEDTPIKCFKCHYEEESGDGMVGCLEELLTDEYIHECNPDLGEDVCYYWNKMSQDLMESVDRGCGVSSVDFNSETDACEDYMRFGEENHHCVCDTNYCNGANGVKIAFSALVVILFGVTHVF